MDEFLRFLKELERIPPPPGQRCVVGPSRGYGAVLQLLESIEVDLSGPAVFR
jgi:hypothetical protein